MPKTVSPVIASRSIGTKPQPRLDGSSGLVLRPWLTEDSPRLREAFRDPAIQFWHTRTISSNEEAETLINDYAQDWRAETRANWAVVSLANELVVNAPRQTNNAKPNRRTIVVGFIHFSPFQSN